MEPLEQQQVKQVESVMGIIAGRWKPAILFSLVMKGPLRFSQLRQQIPRASQRMLTEQLRDLERHGLIRRVVLQGALRHVEYSVTPLGLTLHPFFKSLCDWATEHFPAIEEAHARYDGAEQVRG